MIELPFICITHLISFVECKFEPFVDGGNFANISNFPHSAFMGVDCIDKDELQQSWNCGASIINQEIALTAGHCLFGCGDNSTISVAVGHSHKGQGVKSTVHSYLIHEKCDVPKGINDIALVRLKTKIGFNDNVKRVMLMKHPPYEEKAQIAGWGLINVMCTVLLNIGWKEDRDETFNIDFVHNSRMK